MLLTTTKKYVLSTQSTCAITSITFESWMLNIDFDTFVMIINFVDNYWLPQHVTIKVYLNLPIFFGQILLRF
jgi:hypothetical protein